MTVSRIKVAWICHFSNKEIQGKLRPIKKINEFAPWIASLIDYCKGHEEIELHIISPHEYISGIKTILYKGIKCYFFNAGIPFWGRHWPGRFRFDLWTNFYFSKRTIQKIIERINPDLIHLHGAENAYYSSSIFQFKERYPTLITIQGFLSFTVSAQETKSVKKRMIVEQNILKTFTNFGYRTKTMGKDILSINPNAKLFWHRYPLSKIKNYTNVIKEFDCVFFAKVTKEKGIEDLLKAIAILKREMNDISLLVIGTYSNSYGEQLLRLCDEYDISDNVRWVGFLPMQEDVHKMASRAKVSVLPVYSEIISGTIVESMFLKIPVVAYNVGSIHEINDTGVYVSLVKRGDVNALAKEIGKLLENEDLQANTSKEAFIRANEMFSNDNIYPDLLKAYKSVFNEFSNS